jgi:hypothetical protein
MLLDTKISKIIFMLFIDIFYCKEVVLKLPLTFSGLAKVAIFTTNVDAENQTLINHKTAC